MYYKCLTFVYKQGEKMYILNVAKGFTSLPKNSFKENGHENSERACPDGMARNF